MKQVPFSMCPNWRLLKEHKLTQLRKVGLRRIERELDVARFIRKQLAMTAIIKALTTKAERNCLKQNYRFMLEEDEEISTTSDSDLDGFHAHFFTPEFKVGQNLLKDVWKKHSLEKVKNEVKKKPPIYSEKIPIALYFQIKFSLTKTFIFFSKKSSFSGKRRRVLIISPTKM